MQVPPIFIIYLIKYDLSVLRHNHLQIIKSHPAFL